jgi:hypothetical protein
MPKTEQNGAAHKFRLKFRSTALVVPLLLIFITLSTRYITHPALFDLFAGVSSETGLTVHKRHIESRDGLNSTSTSSTPTQTSESVQPVPTVPTSATLPTPFPQPWDSNIPQNFSSTSCFNFFTNMTNTLAFRSCRPLSLLLQSSSTLVDAQTNLTLLNSIIWGTCQTTMSTEQCSSNMGWFASNLQSDCSQELSQKNAIAVNALIGLQAFDLVNQVGCLSDPSTNTYCYVSAVHNSNPSDVYLYQLPLGLSYPNTTTPTCSSCSKSVMDIYSSALQNSPSILSALQGDYPGAQQILDSTCGSTFAKSVSSGVSQRPVLATSSIVAATSFLIQLWLS